VHYACSMSALPPRVNRAGDYAATRCTAECVRLEGKSRGGAGEPLTVNLAIKA
jgi:hypothetical protein